VGDFSEVEDARGEPGNTETTRISSGFFEWAVPGVVDQDSPHRFSSGSEEVTVTLEMLIPDQTQIRLVDQGCGIERVTWLLRGHLRSRQHTQLVVDERQQVLGGLAVAAVRGFEQSCDVGHDCRFY